MQLCKHLEFLLSMKLLAVAFCFFLSGYGHLLAQSRPEGLLTDLLSNTDTTIAGMRPVIHSSKPSFSWIVPGTDQATSQTAYRIIVSNSASDALLGKGNVWDSKKTAGKKSVSVPFGGADLLPGKEYYWRVKCFTNTGGESDWSAVRSFQTADELHPYQSAHELLVKTKEHPLSINAAKEIPGYFIDFGKDAFGQLTLRLLSETGKDSVDVCLGEVAEGNHINQRPGGSRRFHKYKIMLSKGIHEYKISFVKDELNTRPAAIKMPEYIGEVMPFRYVELLNYKAEITVKDIFRETVHHPFSADNSYFRSSSEVLNKIWDLSKYSIKATSFTGIYVDGDRERIPYEADALINQLGHYGTDREYSMARRSVEYLLKYPTWPTEWILQALILSWNDYLYTGDQRSLSANYEILKNRTLLQLTEKNGLISTTTGLQNEPFARSINFKDKIKDIVDWPVSETDGFIFCNYNAVVNAFHYKALVLMEQIARALGQKKDAELFSGKHKAFKKLYNEAFLKKETGIYRDGDTTGHSALHTNMFALHFGLVPDQYKEPVMKFIASKGMACSVYGSQFLMEALYDGDDAKTALSLLTDTTGDRNWYNMIRVGSTITLEAWDNKYKPNQDWNHAWGAAPANIIPRRLMGVEPLTPGFETVMIKPQTGDLKFAEALVPTIRGGIQVKVENDREYYLSFTIPANMEAEVYLPVMRGKYSITHNGVLVPHKTASGGSYSYVGRYSSGKHEFVLKAD